MRPFDDPPAVVGHRGAPVAAPENTPVSFAAAADAGAQWVELDVRRSSDGVLVLHHDARLPSGPPIADCTADDLAARGVWAFEAVLEALPAGIGVDVEVKNSPGEPGFDEDDELARQVAGLLRGRLAGRRWMTSSFNPFTVAVLAQALPQVPAGLVHGAGVGLGDAAAIGAEHGASVLCAQRGAPGLDAEGIAAAHAAGFAVLVWTVDDVDEAHGLARAGVDAVCTNDPAAMAVKLRDY